MKDDEHDQHPLRHHPLTQVIESALRKRSYVERQDKVGTAIAVAQAVIEHINQSVMDELKKVE